MGMCNGQREARTRLAHGPGPAQSSTVWRWPFGQVPIHVYATKPIPGPVIALVSLKRVMDFVRGI